MTLTQKLDIRLSHALVMTPQLMQAIKLLALSNLELTAYVEAELERNPLLERTGEGDGAALVAETTQRNEMSTTDTGAADRPGDGSDGPPAAAENRLDSPPDHGFEETEAAAARAPADMVPGYSEWAGSRR